MSTHQQQLEELRTALEAPFPIHLVERIERGGKALDYIPIEHMLDRMHEALPFLWDDHVVASSSTPLGTDDKGRLCILFEHTVEVRLYRWDEDGERVLIGVHAGTGADVALGPSMVDSASKTALANARKKAMNAAGVGHYLFHSEGRLRLAQEREQIAKERARQRRLAAWESADANYVSNPGYLQHEQLGEFAAFLYTLQTGESVEDEKEAATRLLALHNLLPDDGKLTRNTVRDALVQIVNKTTRKSNE